MQILVQKGDYGSKTPLTLYPVDGIGINATDLQTATYQFRVYRYTRLRVPMASTDTTVTFPNNENMNYYKANDSIIVGDEDMIVSAVDTANKQATVTRALDALDHPKGTIIRHIVYESPTAVTYDPALFRVVLEIQNDFELLSGLYRFEVEVDTSTRIFSVVGPSPRERYYLRVAMDLGGA